MMRYVLALCACFAAGVASAQEYPTKSVMIIAPYHVGGITDLGARFAAKILGEKLNGSFQVENRNGTNVLVVARDVFNERPDGYKLFAGGSGTLAAGVALHARDVRFDPSKFVPICGVGRYVATISVRSDSLAKDLKSLAAFAKAKGGLNAGAGSDPERLILRLFEKRTGIKMLPVPYHAEGAVRDLLSGNLDVIFHDLNTVKALSESGQVRILAISGDAYTSEPPNVPRLSDMLFNWPKIDTWSGIFAPPGTPEPIVKKLRGAMEGFSTDPDTRRWLVSNSTAPFEGACENVGSYAAESLDYWRSVVEELGPEKEN